MDNQREELFAESVKIILDQDCAFNLSIESTVLNLAADETGLILNILGYGKVVKRVIEFS